MEIKKFKQFNKQYSMPEIKQIDQLIIEDNIDEQVEKLFEKTINNFTKNNDLEKLAISRIRYHFEKKLQKLQSRKND